MKQVKLTKGQYALVDDCDYEMITKMGKWHYMQKGVTQYAAKSIPLEGITPKGRKRRTTVRMHHMVLPKKEGYVVNHINGNGLDNRKENLRYITPTQSKVINPLKKRAISGFRGVIKYPRCKGYGAQVRKEGGYYYLGLYQTPEDAAKAYNIKAKELFGDLVTLNDVDMSMPPEKYRDQYKSARKRVRCIETNIIYESQTAAAKDLNVKRAAISQSMRGLKKDGSRFTIKGYSFEYLENKET